MGKALPLNPEDFPSDMAGIQALIDESQDGTDASSGVVDDKVADSKKEPEKSETPKADEKKEEPPVKQVPIGAVFQEREKTRREREARQAAEAKLAEVQEQINELKAGNAKESASDPGLSDEQMELLREEFPAVAQALESQAKVLKDMQERFAEISKPKVAEPTSIEQKVQQTIESIPELKYWQAEDPEMWDAVTQMDQMILRANPNLSMEERFQMAVEKMESIYGPTLLPPEYEKLKKPPKADTPEPDVNKKAAEAVEKAGDFKPKTLSDLPGGEPPPSDEAATVANMSPVQIGNMLLNMSPEKQMDWLAKFG